MYQAPLQLPADAAGLFGSDDTIWMDPLDIAKGELLNLSMAPPQPRITSLDVIPLAYTLLRLRLQIAGFDADFFPFDWRQSLDVLGQRLAKQIAATTASEVILVAHSMGGLVSRAGLAKLKHPAKVKRVVMLGTPNYGSFVPIEAVRGMYPLLQRVAGFDRKNTPEQLAQKVFRTLPGLCQMLPWPEKFSGVDLFDPNQWPSSKPRPEKILLDEARRVQKDLPLGDERFTLIAGINQFTIVGVKVEQGDFVEQLSLAGDGTVPLELAKMPNVPTYYVEESHGSLQNNSKVIRATIDILNSGSTTALPTQWTPPRAIERSVRQNSLVTRAVKAAPEQMSHRDLRSALRELAAPPTVENATPPAPTTPTALAASFPVRLKGVEVSRLTQQRLDIRLAKGSITDVDARAIVLGVFREVAPTGAARVVDQRLEGAITEFMQRRMFAGHVGEVFVLPAGRKMLRAELAVLVGLGAFDEINASTLQIAAENTIRTLIRTNVEEFATVLFGSGSGTDIEASLQNLLIGFIRGLKDSDHHRRFRSITLCELDSQRYDDLRAALFRLTGTSLFQDLQVTFDETELPRFEPPPSAVRGAAVLEDPVYLIIRGAGSDSNSSATERGLTLGAALSRESSNSTFDVALLTAGTKAAVISETKQVPTTELNDFLETLTKGKSGPDNLPKFGRDLAKMTLPSKVMEALLEMRHRRIVVVNDAEASRMPWETLCLDDGGDGWFPAADAGLSRRYLAQNLSVAKWLEQRRFQEKLEVLLVVNPNAGDPQYDLDGAEKEGARISEMLKSNNAVTLTRLHGAEATRQRLLDELQSGKYDIVHYAGHAFFDPKHRSESGLFCADKRVLTGADCARLGKLPALVFFNACESGRTRAVAANMPGPKTDAHKVELNVSLAEAFLRGGVANYLGLYWPVGDDPAKAFAGEFYQQIIAGAAIGTAVLTARTAVRKLDSVDWCDYVLYGDDSFALKHAIQ